MRLRPVLSPDPTKSWRSLKRSRNPLVGLHGREWDRREGKWEGEEKEERREGREGRRGGRGKEGSRNPLVGLHGKGGSEGNGKRGRERQGKGGEELGALGPGFRSLATLKFAVNVVGEL